MIRIVKDPDVRREELLDVAEELFAKYGCEKTKVSDIVKKTRVAQGTFYYYFKSKSDILDALADRFLEEILEGVEKIAGSDDMDAIDKILNIFAYIKRIGEKRKNLWDYLHEEKNALLHLKVENKAFPIYIGALEKVVEQGIKEDLFNTTYPREAATALIAFPGYLHRRPDYREKSVSERKKLVEATLDLFERVLGAKPGIFSEYVEKMEVDT